MKRLLTAAAVVVSCAVPLPAFAGRVEASTLPALAGRWRPAIPMPFKPTKRAFKKYLESNGYKVLGLSGCEHSDSPAEVSSYDLGEAPSEMHISPALINYDCKEAFLELTDPRGTRRCKARVFYYSKGWTAGGSEEVTGVKTEFPKNDCRWL